MGLLSDMDVTDEYYRDGEDNSENRCYRKPGADRCEDIGAAVLL